MMDPIAPAYVLWFPSWYPSELEPYNGDFIRRHAQALSLYQRVEVFYFVHDKKGVMTKNVHSAQSTSGSMHETIVYYHTSTTGISIIDKLLLARKYRILYRKIVKKYIAEHGAPSLVHVHVGIMAGVIALWVKKRYNVPYVITEHWSGILEEAEKKIADLPFYLRRLWKKIVRHSSGVAAVSQHLASAIERTFGLSQCVVIPNVVDRNIFFVDAPLAGTRHRFVHISGLEPLKNPAIIIRALSKVVRTDPGAKLEIFGSRGHDLEKLVDELQLKSSVQFHPEVPQPVLADALRNSDALVLYSSYETFGCVLIEANACGIPVIVSDLPVFHELVQEGVNGMFAGRSDVDLLADRMIRILSHGSAFDRRSISEMTVNKYSYEVVGRQLKEWYEEVLGNQARRR